MGSTEIWYAIFILAILLAVAYAIRGSLKRLAGGCCGGGDQMKIRKIRVADKNPDHYPYQAVLTIDGMVCGSCAARVENALNGMEGVWATVDLMQGQAVVRMKREISDSDLRAAVNGLGAYTVLKMGGSRK